MLRDHVVSVTGTGEFADALRAGLTDLGAAFDGDVDARVDAMVHVPAIAMARPVSLIDVDEPQWDAQGEALIRDAIAACQQAFAQMRGLGGAIVLITPTAGMAGEAGYVPVTTATEGMRSLAKGAARQWGEHGITVNCVAPPLELFGATVAPPIEPPVLGRPPEVRTDVARTVAMLVTNPFVTGATVVVDGGVVMNP